MRRWYASILLPLILVLGLVACKDSTGPSYPGMNGAWSYNATVEGEGLVCSFENTILTLSQKQDSFTGSMNGGRILCTSYYGDSYQMALPAFTVLSGTVSQGGTVRFDLHATIDGDTWRLSNTGNVQERTMSGTTQFFAGSDFQLVGTFTGTHR